MSTSDNKVRTNESSFGAGRSKKKFLYLDKFTDHLAEDQKWKKMAEEQEQRITRIVIALMLLDFLAIVISVVAIAK